MRLWDGSDYICEILDFGYEIRRGDFKISETTNMLLKIPNIKNSDEPEIREVIAKQFRQTVSKDFYIIDLKNNIEVSPTDIGVGISQIIPIIVGAIASEKASIFSIEQPELHLHPAAQCSMADIFISEKFKNKIFLIETHSEHLILRFLRRIRETFSGELKNSEFSLKPNELGVIYINHNKDRLVLTEIPVDNDGEFTMRWPDGFFEERANELFGETDA